MKLSDLIARLQALQAEHGDLNVYRWDNDYDVCPLAPAVIDVGVDGHGNPCTTDQRQYPQPSLVL